MRPTLPSFMALYVAGKIPDATAGEHADDAIDVWHDSGIDVPLYAYLGMTRAECCRWIVDPSCLPALRAARLAAKEDAK